MGCCYNGDRYNRVQPHYSIFTIMCCYNAALLHYGWRSIARLLQWDVITTKHFHNAVLSQFSTVRKRCSRKEILSHSSTQYPITRYWCVRCIRQNNDEDIKWERKVRVQDLTQPIIQCQKKPSKNLQTVGIGNYLKRKRFEKTKRTA